MDKMNPILKTNTIVSLNEAIMSFPPLNNIETHPKIHYNLNPAFLAMRQELHSIKLMLVETRRENIRLQLMKDYIDEEKELGEVQLGLINTQP